MPYVTKDKRSLLDPYLKEIYEYYIDSARNEYTFPYNVITKLVDNIEVNGDLNYCLSWLCWKIFLSNKRYATADKIIDVLERIKIYINDCDGTGSLDSTLLLLVGRICRQVKPKLRSILGTITCVQLEMYRRQIGIYEDLAILKNGDLEI